MPNIFIIKQWYAFIENNAWNLQCCLFFCFFLHQGCIRTQLKCPEGEEIDKRMSPPILYFKYRERKIQSDSTFRAVGVMKAHHLIGPSRWWFISSSLSISYQFQFKPIKKPFPILVSSFCGLKILKVKAEPWSLKAACFSGILVYTQRLVFVNSRQNRSSISAYIFSLLPLIFFQSLHSLKSLITHASAGLNADFARGWIPESCLQSRFTRAKHCHYCHSRYIHGVLPGLTGNMHVHRAGCVPVGRP